jgi:acetolactate decarboxylase
MIRVHSTRREMQRRFGLLCLLFLAVPMGAAEGQNNDPGIFQYSTLEALLEGVYDGDLRVGTLAKQGALGLGTFNGLDGEMIVLDGEVWQVPVTGRPQRPTPETRSPYASVVPFKAQRTGAVDPQPSKDALFRALDGLATNPNIFYAFRLHGTFAMLRARSVPKQTPPYPRLTEVVKQQAVFEYRNITGTLLGFRSPDYAKGLRVPGYHLHFLADDRAAGGHLLDLSTTEGLTVDLMEVRDLQLHLPDSKAFAGAELGGDKAADVRAVESK